MSEATPTDPGEERRRAVHETLVQAEKEFQAKHYHTAIGICQDVLEANPEHPPALALLGGIMGHRGDLVRGAEFLERAIAKEPNIPAWHSNLSGLYRMQYRVQDAVRAAQEAVRLGPGHARFHVNLGKAFVDSGDGDSALAAFLAALGRDAGNAEAHLAIGQILLARGDMTPGWREYEWRNQLEMAKGMLPKMVAAQWNGMRLPNDRLLLVGDQGYGDTLQFCRFIHLAVERCKEVVLGCSPDLAPLLRNIPGIAQTYTRWNEIPHHLAYCMLSSLPGLFGIQANAIPSAPYLSPDPARVQAWADRLEQKIPPERFRVGICWAGRPTHPNDRRRSMRLLNVAPLAGMHGVVFVSLMQKIPRCDVDGLHFPDLIDISGELTDFAETAAVISNLDLVITIDTAVGHLAGAMGLPVWLMLANPADWRWMLDRADTPWYPTMRLFRQPLPGDWESVVDAVNYALSEVARVGRIKVSSHQVVCRPLRTAVPA